MKLFALRDDNAIYACIDIDKLTSFTVSDHKTIQLLFDNEVMSVAVDVTSMYKITSELKDQLLERNNSIDKKFNSIFRTVVSKHRDLQSALLMRKDAILDKIKEMRQVTPAQFQSQAEKSTDDADGVEMKVRDYFTTYKEQMNFDDFSKFVIDYIPCDHPMFNHNDFFKSVNDILNSEYGDTVFKFKI